MTKIAVDEMAIVGGWVLTNGNLTDDFNSKRIASLLSEVLVEISRDESGWDALFVDPRDNRLWELTYPESSSHGGGAPRLDFISNENAERKYDFAKKV
jgi:hypothetical protein